MKIITHHGFSLGKNFIIALALSLAATASIHAESVFFGTVEGRIYQVNTDGSNLNLVYNQFNAADFRGMAVDDVNGHLYVQNTFTSSIIRMNLDGTGVTTIATGLDVVLSMQVDPSAGKLFYSLIDWESSNSTVVSRNLDGSGATTIFTGINQSNTVGISIDPVAQRVYVADSGQNVGVTSPHANVSSVSYTGADLVNLYSNNYNSEIAVADGNLFTYSYFSIDRGTTTGGAQQSIFSPGVPNSIVAGLATNPDGDMVYAVQLRQAAAGFDRLVAMNLNGGDLITLASVGTNWKITDLAYSTSTSTVPEPSTWALLFLGAALVLWTTRHRRRSALQS